MSFLGILLELIELFWCTLMPIIGSLHLISPKYNQENSDKLYLLRHWCFYWMIFVVLNVFSGYLVIIPSAIRVFLRIALLSLMASPKLGITLSLLEYVQGKTETIIGFKNMMAGFVKEQLGAKEKTA